MNAMVRLRDVCDIDFSPGRPLFPVEIEGARSFAPHEIEQMQLGIKSGLLMDRRKLLLGLGVGAAVAFLLSPRAALATNRTAWTAGNGVGYTWTTLINTADLATMPTGSTVLSSVADITNQSAQDQFMDISVAEAIASSTIVAGASLGFWQMPLNQDGTTYGDGNFAAGTQKAATPANTQNFIGSIGLIAAAAQTSLVGAITNIPMDPGSFRVAEQNNSGFTFSGTQTVKYRTYNINLNN